MIDDQTKSADQPRRSPLKWGRILNLLILIAIVLLGYFIYDAIRGTRSALEEAAQPALIHHLSAHEMREKMSKPEQPSIILDVRTPYEWEHEAHLAGSMYVHPDDISLELLEKIPDLNTQIILISSPESQATQTLLTEFLSAHGYTQIFQLQHGVESWIEAGLPILTPDPTE